MRHLGAIALILCVGCGDWKPPAQPGPVQPSVQPPAPPPPTSPVFRDQKSEFTDAIRELGTPTIIDFEDVDARPVTDTIRGRTPFDGRGYAGRGVMFSNPNNLLLYVAPGGLFWNPTNSLSVGRFPFDPLPHTIEAPFIEDDDLVVTLDPGCSAAAFSVIDRGIREFVTDDFVHFLDAQGELIHKVEFPNTFLGIVSPVRAIARILVSEAANDGDDVTYDDFVCVRQGSALSVSRR